MRKLVSIILAFALITTMVVLSACNNGSINLGVTSFSPTTPASTGVSPVPSPTIPPTTTTNPPPAAPQQLTASKITTRSVALTWQDRSGNEDNFQLYRDGALLNTLPPDTTYYEDQGLKPAATYVYQVKAVNVAGLSGSASCTATTLNPPIKVVLDRIGVHDNGESGIRNPFGTNNGEVQVGIVVTDGKSTIKKVFPAQGYYELKEDAVVDVGATVFETGEVGDYLRITVTAYENDGGLGEQVLYDALEFAVKMYIGPGASSALTLSGIDLSEEIGGLFGEESDWLGTYDKQWLPADNWGVGRYVDVQCPIGDGKVGLRLWFTVE